MRNSHNKNLLQVVMGPGRYAVGLGLLVSLSACDKPPEEQVDCDKLHAKVDQIVNPCPDGQSWEGYHNAQRPNEFRLTNENLPYPSVPACDARINFSSDEPNVPPSIVNFAVGTIGKLESRGCGTRQSSSELSCWRMDSDGNYFVVPPPSYVDEDGQTYYEILSGFTANCTKEIASGSDEPTPRPPAP